MKFIRPLSQTTLISDANLVSYWTLDGNANDYKNVNNGTSVNVTYGGQYAQFGQGGYFNGSAYIVNNTPVTVPTNASMACWIKTTQVPSAINPHLMTYRSAGSVAFTLALVDTTGQLNFAVRDSLGNVVGVVTTGAYNNGQWHHVVGVKSGNNIYLYVNGVLMATGSQTFTGNFDNALFRMGSRDATSDLYIGSLDDAMFFNRALTATEVAYLAAGETFINNRPLADTRFFTDANLVSYWKLDGNSTDSKGIYNGTDTAITYGTQYGIFGQGASFNGSSSYISYSSKVMPIGAKTVSFWFKTSYTGNYQQFYDDCNCGTAAGSTILTNKTTGILRFYSYNRYDVGTPNNVCDGMWHHFTGTWDGTTNTGMVKLYIDGILVNTGTASSTESVAATYNSMIGRRNVDIMYYLNGNLEDISIFNRALSYTEVQELYEKEVVRAIYRPLEQTRFRNDDNLVAYWKLDGNSTDSKGGFTGTDTAVTYVDGLFGKVASFNGSSSKIVVPYNIALNVNNITISAWWKWDSPSVIGDNMIIDRLFSAGSVNPWASFRINAYVPDVNTRYFVCYIGKSSGVYGFINSTSLQLGVWYHVTFTYDGTYLRVYINGVENATAVNYTSGIGYGDNQGVTIGARMATSSDSYAKGLLDDISLFNRALSREEVAELYQSQTVGEIQPLNYKPQGGLYATSLINDANLVSYWKMDGNSRDSKGSNHGTDSAVAYAGSYGRFGQGGYYNGSTSVTTCGNTGIPMGASARTLSAWYYKIGNVDWNMNTIVGWGSAAAGSYSILAIYNDKVFFWDYRDDVGGTTVIPNGVWVHVCATYDGTTEKVYLNGILEGSKAVAINTISSNVWIGDSPSNLPCYGYIDDVAVFSRALSAAEVFEIYSKGESSPLRPLDSIPTLRQDSSLVSYWKLNGDATDSKGTNNGTATNVTYSVGVNGRFGQAGIFDGTTSIITTTQINMTRYTWAMWIKPNGVQTDSAALISEQYSGNYVQYAQYFNPSTLSLIVGSYDGTWHTTPAYTIADGVWQHIVHTYDGNYHRLYVNGVNVSSLAWTGTPLAQGLQTRIGRRWDNPNFFKGMMDDISAFNRALTNAEIYQLYTQGSTVGYWKLNGSSTDYSGNGNHGTDTAITYAQGNGVFNQGALFNGSTSRISCGTNTSLKSSFITVSVWFKSTSSSTAYLVDKKSAASGGWDAYAIIYTGNGNLRARCQYNSTPSFSDFTTTGLLVNDGNWHNCVMTYMMGAHMLYVDGALMASATPTSSLYYSTDVECIIGAANSSGTYDYYFNGSIDEVIIENRPWSASEVRKYYTKSKRMFI